MDKVIFSHKFTIGGTIYDLQQSREAGVEAVKKWFETRYGEKIPFGLNIDAWAIVIRRYHADEFGRKRSGTLIEYGNSKGITITEKSVKKLDEAMQANKIYNKQVDKAADSREQVRNIRKKFEADNGDSHSFQYGRRYNVSIKEPHFHVNDEGKIRVYDDGQVYVTVRNSEDAKKDFADGLERLEKWYALDGMEYAEYVKDLPTE